MNSSRSDRLARLVAALVLLGASTPAWGACDRAALFGHGWLDLDGDGRDTREDLLEAADRGGWWLDPYDGAAVTDPSLLDVDHVVPLCLALEWGADQWPEDLRRRFANDPVNLVVVGRSSNRSKSDRPPSDWMPRNVAFWGPYLTQVGAVLDKYGLVVPPGESAALACYRRFLARTGKGFRPGYWRC